MVFQSRFYVLRRAFGCEGSENMVMQLRSAAIAAAMMFSAVAGVRTSAATDAFTYQGVLQDGGQLANGAYDLLFRLFDAPTGGSQVGPDVAFANEAVSDGLIQQRPDFSSVFDGRRLWIEVSVRRTGGVSPVALPRQEVLAAPQAQFAMRAAEATYALTSGTTLEEAIINGSTVDLAGRTIDLSDSVNMGELRLGVGNGVGQNTLDVLDPSGGRIVRVAEDASGAGGGFMLVSTTPGGPLGIEMNGNDGSGNAALFVDGASGVAFDSAQSGSASVVLPVDAIDSTELANEPGLARRDEDVSFVLPSNPPGLSAGTIMSRSIVAPSDGFVIAIATMEESVTHGPANTQWRVGFSLVPGELELEEQFSGFIPLAAPAGLYIGARTIHRVYQVEEGLTTIHLTGFSLDPTGSAYEIRMADVHLSLLFIPTAYGTVSGGGVGEAPVVEREASIADNVARMEAEMAAMRAEIEAMRAERRSDAQVGR